MIGETETALVARIRELFGNTLNEVDTHPGVWDDKTLRRIIASTPSVYLTWLGCGAGRTWKEVESRWVIYVVTSTLNGRDKHLGAYQIVERLISGLVRGIYGQSTGFRLSQVRNLYSDDKAMQGVVLYGVYFTATTPMPNLTDMDSLSDLQDYGLDLVPGSTTPAADSSTD